MNASPRVLDGFNRAFLDGDPEAIGALDETPLWSVPFGLRLLEAVKLMPGIQVLDIGCGAGFPSLELASRLGTRGKVTGLDPWREGLNRATHKAQLRGIQSIEYVEGCAEGMPFADASFDTLVSNNGLNNVTDVPKSLGECARVARPHAQFVMTANLPATFGLFYEVFESLLEERGLEHCIPHLHAHIQEKRKPREAWEVLVQQAGFQLRKVREDTFTWSFLNGTSFLQHWAVRLAFLPAWVNVLPEDRGLEFLAFLEGRLNRLALERGGLHLEVPFFCLDARRV